MAWTSALRHTLRELLRPARLDAELDDELREHFERELSRQLEIGVPADEAHRRARLRVGRLDLAREAVGEERSSRRIADAGRDLRFAVRALGRSPGFTAAVVLSLGLGVGGTTAIFGVVDTVLLRPLPLPESQHLYLLRVWWRDFSASLSPADFFALTAERRPLADIGAYSEVEGGFTMDTPNGPEVVEGGIITPELPRVLGISPILGRGLSADPHAREALIGETLWRRLGQRADIIGRSLTLDGVPCAIVGVMPEGFGLPGPRPGLIWARAQLEQPTRRGPFFLNTVVRLAPDVPAEAAEAALTSAVTPILQQRYGVTDVGRYRLRLLKDVLVGDVRETLLLTFGAVGLVLLIAIANVTNLLLARGTARARELAIRASLGAGRLRLARQLLAESAVLGLLGGSLGLALAVGVFEIAGAAAMTEVPRMSEMRLDLTLVLFALVSGVAAGLMASLLPIVRLPWTRLSDWLREGGRTLGESAQHGRVRQALVVAEVALTLTVLTGAALLVESLVRLQRVDPGFEPAGVLSFRLALPASYADEARLAAFRAELATRLAGLPGVTSAAGALSLPPDLLDMTNNLTVEGARAEAAGASGVAEWNVVDGEYFRTLGIGLRNGRTFNTGDLPNGPQVAIVNEAFERRFYPGGNAIGKRLKGGDWDASRPWTTIVGVAADVPYEKGVWGGSSETVYTPYSQNQWMTSPYMVVKTSGDPSRLVGGVRDAVTGLDPRVPLRDVATMDERVYRSAAAPRFRGLLFSLLGGLALVLAVIGIYGVMAYHVSQRRRETAIRRALGARGGQVVGATIRAGMQLTLGGVALGALGALASAQSLSALLFQVDPRDPFILVGAATLVTLASLAACAVPAVRAARIDPATILREE